MSEYDAVGTISQKEVEDLQETVEELKAFLIQKNHPIVASWTSTSPSLASSGTPTSLGSSVTQLSSLTLPIGSTSTGGSIKVILKNVRLHAEKVIIIREDE